MIRHTVTFKLKHEAGTPQEQAFLAKAQALALIPGVEKFEVLKQISTKNDYDFGLSMEFAGQGEYDAYNQHPEHVSFVENVWMVEVLSFMEIDYLVES